MKSETAVATERRLLVLRAEKDRIQRHLTEALSLLRASDEERAELRRQSLQLRAENDRLVSRLRAAEGEVGGVCLPALLLFFLPFSPSLSTCALYFFLPFPSLLLPSPPFSHPASTIPRLQAAAAKAESAALRSSSELLGREQKALLHTLRQRASAVAEQSRCVVLVSLLVLSLLLLLL